MVGVLCGSLLLGAGIAVDRSLLDNSLAQALRSNMTSARETIARAAISASSFATQANQQLAASSESGIGSTIRRIICTFLRNCPSEAATPTAAPESQPPLSKNSNSYSATSSQNVKAPSPAPPAPAAGSAPATSVAGSNNSAPVQQTVIQQPVIERIRETVRTVVEGGLSASYVDERLLALQQSLQSQIAAVSAAQSSRTDTIYQTVGMVGRIEELTNTKLHTPIIDGATITGGSITAASISGTISNIIDAVSATIADLTATTLVATNSTTTNATTTNLAVTGNAVIGSGTGVLQTTSGFVSSIANGSNGQVLKIAGGVATWSTDLTGSGGGASVWATTSDDLAIVEADPTDVVIIGATATSTTGNILEVAGASLFRGLVRAYQTVTAPNFTATSSTASTLPYASSTAISVSGTGYFGAASTSNLTISGAAGGLLKTSAIGVVSVATAGTDYVSGTTGDWTGTLDGYEASSLLGSAFSTTSASYFSSLGLAFSTTSADAWKDARNFFSTTSADYYTSVTNFFSTTSADAWKLTRNFFSTTSADYWETQQTARTADDLTNNSIEDLNDVASITENFGDLFAWNGSSWTDFATSSLAIALADTTGILGATRGGTGLSSISAAGILLGNYSGTGWQQLATSTLGLLSTNVAEGSNLYYQDSRVQSYLDAIAKGFFFSTTSAQHFASAGLAFSTTSTDFWKSANNFFSTTSAQYFVDASSTIPKTYSANTFTALQTFGSASTTNISASYASSTQGFFGSLSIGNLSGFLKATAGAIATAAVDLANDVTGILGVANGGTGWSNIASGAIVLGNGAGSLATTSAGTNGQVLALVSGTPTWVATSTLSTISGTLAAGSGGTGITNPTSAGILLGSYGGGSWQQIATSSLNISTDNLVQGSSNLFYSNSLVQSFIHSSSTIPKTYTDNTFTGS
ncbi:MAG TPA: hypothetical protein VNI78_00505 [Vicinamibacterales bacterium]|nr:hypothetical protein [Vicinamibacterales bacterium]